MSVFGGMGRGLEMGGIMGVMVWLALLFGSERESLIVSGVDEGGVEETVC